jgi:ankyrin repeat protein
LTYSRLEVPAGAAPEIAKLLLANGADPNAGYLWQGMPSPFTALTGAFGRGEGDQPPHQNRLELARLLLEAGADANDSQTMYNCGPGCPPPYDDDHLELLGDELVFASSERLLHRVELVLAQGIDPDGHGFGHPVFAGHRAYELAAIQGYDGIAALLRAAGAAPLDDLHELYAAAFRGGPVDADTKLAARAVRRNPRLALWAAERGRTEALEPLQRLGFDLNLSGRTTSLHQAAFRGHLDTVKKLIELGADPTVEDPNYHSTPRGWAEHNHQQEVVDYLDSLKD